LKHKTNGRNKQLEVSSYRIYTYVKPAYCFYLPVGKLNGKASEISVLGVKTFYSMKAAIIWKYEEKKIENSF